MKPIDLIINNIDFIRKLKKMGSNKLLKCSDLTNYKEVFELFKKELKNPDCDELTKLVFNIITKEKVDIDLNKLLKTVDLIYLTKLAFKFKPLCFNALLQQTNYYTIIANKLVDYYKNNYNDLFVVLFGRDSYDYDYENYDLIFEVIIAASPINYQNTKLFGNFINSKIFSKIFLMFYTTGMHNLDGEKLYDKYPVFYLEFFTRLTTQDFEKQIKILNKGCRFDLLDFLEKNLNKKIKINKIIRAIYRLTTN